MPSAGKHLKYSEQHFLAASEMRHGEPSRSWAGVALFYTAHQLVHAVLACDVRLPPEFHHPENHTSQASAHPGTQHAVATYYREVLPAYLDLSGWSQGVRYKGQQLSETVLIELVEDVDDIRAWAYRLLLGEGRAGLPSWLQSSGWPSPVS